MDKQHQFGKIDDEDLFLSLKCHIDSQQKLIQLYRTRIRSFEIFRKKCQRLVHFDDGGKQIKFNLEQFQNEYNKFDRNCRYEKKKIQNLRKQTKSTLSIQNQNVYDILYDILYLFDNQIYPKVSTNKVIKLTESANTQDKSIQCDFNDFSSDCTKINQITRSQYNNSEIQFLQEKLPDIVEQQQLELTTNDSIDPNDPVNNDGDSEDTLDNSDDYDNEDYCFVEPRQQTAKPQIKVNTLKRKSSVQCSIKVETDSKTNKSTKSKCVLKKIKQEICTENFFTDSTSSLLQKRTKGKNERNPKPNQSTELLKCDAEGCQYSTTNSWNINEHKRTHSDARPFKCDKCDLAFKMKRYLNVHKNIHEGRRFSCKFEGCTVNYSSKGDISKHIKIFHTKEAPLLRCSWDGCDYTTCRSENLRVHRRVHTGERPFKCHDCEKAFKSKGNLWTHKLAHQNERSFKCDFEGCDYAGYSKDLLQRHQFVHNVDRQFNCVWPGCGKSFKSRTCLWKHKARHENQRRYRCKWEGCEYAANLSGDFRFHVQTVHEKKKQKKRFVST